MFTGLIEEIGVVKYIQRGQKSAKITIQAKKVLDRLAIGDSIATNGICLTVTDFNDNTFTVDVMPETMAVSNLGTLKTLEPVNLERAMLAGARFGGHMVAGHVDGVGTIIRMEKEENAVLVTIGLERQLMRYMIRKGSIAIDGISLTIAKLLETVVVVSIISHTKGQTTLLGKAIGDRVNIECDLIGKYVESLLQGSKTQREGNLTIEFLQEHGF